MKLHHTESLYKTFPSIVNGLVETFSLSYSLRDSLRPEYFHEHYQDIVGSHWYTQNEFVNYIITQAVINAFDGTTCQTGISEGRGYFKYTTSSGLTLYFRKLNSKEVFFQIKKKKPFRFRLRDTLTNDFSEHGWNKTRIWSFQMWLLNVGLQWLKSKYAFVAKLKSRTDDEDVPF